MVILQRSVVIWYGTWYMFKSWGINVIIKRSVGYIPEELGYDKGQWSAFIY